MRRRGGGRRRRRGARRGRGRRRRGGGLGSSVVRATARAAPARSATGSGRVAEEERRNQRGRVGRALPRASGLVRSLLIRTGRTRVRVAASPLDCPGASEERAGDPDRLPAELRDEREAEDRGDPDHREGRPGPAEGIGRSVHVAREQELEHRVRLRRRRHRGVALGLVGVPEAQAPPVVVWAKHEPAVVARLSRFHDLVHTPSRAARQGARHGNKELTTRNHKAPRSARTLAPSTGNEGGRW